MDPPPRTWLPERGDSPDGVVAAHAAEPEPVDPEVAEPEEVPETAEATAPPLDAVELERPGKDIATPTDSKPVPATAPAVSQFVLERRSCTARSLCDARFTTSLSATDPDQRIRPNLNFSHCGVVLRSVKYADRIF